MNDEDRANLYAALRAMGLEPFRFHKITEDDIYICVRIYGEATALEDMLLIAAGDDGVGLLGRYQQRGFRAEVTKAASLGAMLQVFYDMLHNYEEYVGRMQIGMYTD